MRRQFVKPACVCLSQQRSRGRQAAAYPRGSVPPLGSFSGQEPSEKAELEVGAAGGGEEGGGGGGGEPRAWRAVSPGLQKVKLQRLTLLTLEQAGRVQTPAHPSESSKRSLDLQSLPVVVEKKVMWGLHSSIKKITNPTLKIALRFPSHAGGLNVMCLAGRLPKTLPGSSNAVAHQTILCFSLFPGCPASLPYSFFSPCFLFSPVSYAALLWI